MQTIYMDLLLGFGFTMGVAVLGLLSYIKILKKRAKRYVLRYHKIKKYFKKNEND